LPWSLASAVVDEYGVEVGRSGTLLCGGQNSMPDERLQEADAGLQPLSVGMGSAEVVIFQRNFAPNRCGLGRTTYSLGVSFPRRLRNQSDSRQRPCESMTFHLRFWRRSGRAP
jgi:hypothetical protein